MSSSPWGRNRTTMEHPEDRAQKLLDNYGIVAPPCGAYIPDGWFSLVERLIVDLIALGWDRNCQQIKEKFGGLRFYIGEGTPEVRARITAAEDDARVTCTVCGALGSFKNTNGRFVACEAHGGSTP